MKAEDNWNSVTFEDLPKYDSKGTLYQYQVVEETSIPGYEDTEPVTAGAAGKAEFTNTLLTVDLEVTKTWDDQGNRYQTRPENLGLSISYTYQDSEEAPVLLDPQPAVSWQKNGDVWTAKLTGLPKYIPGTDTEAEYIVSETGIVGYHADGEASKKATGNQASFRNVLETVDIAGSKTWDDNDNKDGKRPSKITIRLYADGKPMPDHVAKVSADDGWQWRFKALPKYDTYGREIVYTITEDPVNKYQSKIEGYNVTNSYTPDTSHTSHTSHTSRHGTKAPQTGDSSHVQLWLAALLLSVCGIIGFALNAAKKRKKK